MTEHHAKELCAAATELYQQLQSGHFRTSGGRRRAIAGDIAKLRYCENLSEKAKLLERNIRYVSSHLGGVQEVRTKIGNALFGARVLYGEPVFVTVSPSSRHSGFRALLSKLGLSPLQSQGRIQKWQGICVQTRQTQRTDYIQNP